MPTSDDYFLLIPNRFRERRFLHKVAFCVFVVVSLLTLTLLLGFFSTKTVKPAHYTCQTPKYDYDLLAIRWTPTYCASHLCINNTEDWNIHGLWPNMYNDSRRLYSCCKTWGFEESQIVSLLPSLNKEWPNQDPKRPVDSLWQHEWDKHGTCSSIARVGGLIGYFNTTLTLFNRYPIEKWLTDAKITPTLIDSEDAAYNLTSVEEAIKSQLGKNITIKCSPISKSSKSKVRLLDTIYLCFNPKTEDLIDCPFNSGRCRSEKVFLPRSLLKG